MPAPSAVTTFLFTDIEDSTRLWEREPGRMRAALARHDALARSAIEGRRGSVVKTTGDGVHAVFDDPLDALVAVLDFQRGLAGPDAGELPLSVRCGLHLGVVEQRDADYFGSAVNRAARIMSAAHGGQVLMSLAVAELVRARLPDGVALRDLGSVRLRGIAEPERVFQLVHPDLREAFPALRALVATPHNLPAQLTSFVGREQELAALRELLRRERLVTIVGAGGLGKTRLSLQAAAGMLDAFPDGVWFVELAPIAEGHRIAAAVATVLGVKDVAGASTQEALVAHCRERALLLILDNCEHVIDDCARLVAALLRGAPRLAILASARERLNIGGEIVHALAPLVVPDADAMAAGHDVARSDAVRLFADRAAAAQPAFRLSAANLALVAEICRRLDGIPLAIELAAARVRTLPVEAIAARLDDRFRLLTGGDRSLLPRQQTLRALIDWSHALLSAPEKALFRRLAVFPGAFALPAAEAVAGNGEVARDDVLDLLARLVEKSLVVLAADGSHYRMLETIREYAAEQLAAADDARAVRDRHLHYCVDVAEAQWSELSGPGQAKALARLDFERESMLAAHAWCDAAGDGPEMGVRLSYALKSYWINRGLLELGMRLAREALARSRGRTLLRCRALFNAGQVACWIGRYAEAREWLDESLAIARELGDARRVAAALQPLGMACLGLGDVDAARAHLAEALTLARAQSDAHDLAAALNAMAQFLRSQDEVEASLPLYEEMLALARRMGDRESVAIGLLNVAMATIAGRSGGDAAAMLREVLAIVDETGSKPVLQSLFEVSSGLATARGESAVAADIFGAAEAHAGRTGLTRDPADEAFLAPLVASCRRALGDAAFAAAETRGRARRPDDALAQLRSWLASASAASRG